MTHILNILKLPTEWWRVLSLFGLSVFFVYFGIDHFINPDFYLSIMPPAFPLHAEAVYISGFFEILGGICVLIPSLRKLAGWGLIALLVSVYPANIYMAINPEAFPEISSDYYILDSHYNFYLFIGLTQ